MANDKNLKNFKKGQSGNPKGRPKGLVTTILAELKQDGELVGRSLVEQTYQVMLSLTQKQLTKIASDQDQPMINRIVSREMLSKKGFEIIEKMMDRANGKPTQMVIAGGTLSISTENEDLTKLSTDELKQRIREYNDIAKSKQRDKEKGE